MVGSNEEMNVLPLGCEIDETPHDSVVMDQTKIVTLEQAIAVTNLETEAPLTERNLVERVHTEVYLIDDCQLGPDLEIDNEQIVV